MRRLFLSLAGAAVLALAVPGSALATPQWNPIQFDVNPSAGWTYEPGVVRHKTDRGSIILDLTDTTDGGICVRLISTRTTQQFGDVVCYGPGQYGPQTLATNVLAGTNFRVQAHKRVAAGINNHWAGRLYY